MRRESSGSSTESTYTATADGENARRMDRQKRRDRAERKTEMVAGERVGGKHRLRQGSGESRGEGWAEGGGRAGRPVMLLRQSLPVEGGRFA